MIVPEVGRVGESISPIAARKPGARLAVLSVAGGECGAGAEAFL
jgi:hypothetical protein